jgi:hypothetical protein
MSVYIVIRKCGYNQNINSFALREIGEVTGEQHNQSHNTLIPHSNGVNQVHAILRGRTTKAPKEQVF